MKKEGGVVQGKKIKNKNKKKKISESIENNEKYNEDEF